MRRKLVLLALLTATVCGALYAGLVLAEQRQLAQAVIRLHVKADSDRPEDQQIKLAVRDALLPAVTRATAGCADRAAAELALRRAIPELGRTALAALHARQPGQTLSIRLAEEDFPTRDYGAFALPAGPYQALRVTVGSGGGRNWWCVAFPALCLPAAAEDFDGAVEAAGLSGEAKELLTGDDLHVELKFRVLEWVRTLFGE